MGSKQGGALPAVPDRLGKTGGAETTLQRTPHSAVSRNVQIPYQLNVGNVIVNVLVKEMKMAEL